jgi:hypothetical protein
MKEITKAKQKDLVPPPKADSTRGPSYPQYDLDKRQANMLSSAILEARTFLEQLHSTLGDRRQRIKVSPKELAIVSAILGNFAPEQGWKQDEVDQLATDLKGGGGTKGDGKDIGTVPH